MRIVSQMKGDGAASEVCALQQFWREKAAAEVGKWSLEAEHHF